MTSNVPYKAQNRRERGVVGILVAIVASILILSALRVNLRGYVDTSPERALDSNFVLIIETGKIVWTDYIRGPIVTVYTGYIRPFFKGEWLSGLRTKIEHEATIP